MAISIGDALLHLGVDKSELDAGVKSAVDSIKSQMKTAGVALTGFGAAITGALAMAVKSAAEEEAGIIKLTQALKNVGVEYDVVRESLEANIDATQQKTSIADDTQRESLQRLLEVTGNYQKSLNLLPLTLDMAAAKGMDAASAAEVIGRVAAGNTTILSRYGIQLREGATATEALGALQQKFGGQAEAYGKSVAGQFALIKNNISDLMESIGSTVLPILKDFFQNTLNPIIQRLKAWADEHPNLVKQLVILAGVVGGFAAILGPILIMLPILATSFTILMGPIGWVVLAIMGLVTVGTLLWQNWDKVVEFFKTAWSNIKMFFLSGIMSVLDGLSKFTKFIPGLNNLVESAKEKIQGMIDAEEIRKDAREASRAVEEWADEQKKLAEEATIAKKAELQTQHDDASKAYDDEIDELRKTYGVLEGYDKDYQETKIGAARRSRQEREKEIDHEMDALQDAHDEAIQLIDDEYDARLKLIDEQAASEITGLNQEIDNIRKVQEVEDQARQDKENADKQVELEAAVTGAKTDEERIAAQKALDAFLEQQRVDRLRRDRDAQIDSLRDQIDAIRKNAQAEKDTLREQTDAKKAALQEGLDATLATLQSEKDGLDAALEAELVRLETERQTAENVAKDRLDKTIQRIDSEEEKLNKQLEDELAAISSHVDVINAETARLQDRIVTITTVHQDIYSGGSGELKKYATGGLITEPSLLSSMRTGLPYAIAGEAGTERVSPTGETQMMTIILEQDGRQIARQIMPYVVGEVRLKSGIRSV